MSVPIYADTPLPLEFFERKYSVSRTTIWRYRRAGLIALRIGAKSFIRESDFVAFLEKMNGNTPSPEGSDQEAS